MIRHFQWTLFFLLLFYTKAVQLDKDAYFEDAAAKDLNAST